MSAFRRKPEPQEEPGSAADPNLDGIEEPRASEAEPAAAPPADDGLEQWRERCLRAMAELQNLKRRSSQDVEERTLLRLEGMLSELLRVDDYFAAALEHVPESVRRAEGSSSFLAGVTAIRQALEAVLLGNGAVFLEPAPESSFDPTEHEAVEVLESAELLTPRLELLSRGCRFGRRILRPARVRLLRPPSAV